MAVGGTLNDPYQGAPLEAQWGIDVSDVIEAQIDAGTAGKVWGKVANGTGKGTVGWVDPPTAVTADYQPPYVSTFGANGATTSFTIPHGLGTKTPHVSWWEPAGGGQFREIGGVFPVSASDGNSFTVNFAGRAPATGTYVNVSIGGGKDGPIINMLPAVANATARTALTGMAVNDAVFQQNSKHIWVWNGTAWDDWGDQFPTTPHPLYTITGYTVGLPPGETVAAEYADIDAFEAAVVPAHAGQRCQLAGHPVASTYAIYVASWNGTAFGWVLEGANQ